MKDGWLRAALRDEKVAAELLLRLRQTSNPPPPPPPPPVIPPWGQRQQRSSSMRKYSSSSRCSPRTPLSWSATASPSEETSVSCPLSSSRSKNFSQLKEEETQLLKDRVDLKRELDSIHVNLKEQRSRSDNLKRIKFDLNQQSAEGGVLSTAPEVRFSNYRSQMLTPTAKGHQSILPRQAIEKKCALANSCGMQEAAETNKGGFILPDLNMPVGEDEIAAELW